MDPDVMAGVPVIHGTRIPVTTMVGLLGQGLSVGEVAAAAADERELPLRRPG